MKLDYILAQLRRFGTVEARSPGSYAATVGPYHFAFAAHAGRPGLVTHFSYSAGGTPPWVCATQLGRVLRKAVGSRREAPVGPFRVEAIYGLASRGLREEVHVHVRRVDGAGRTAGPVRCADLGEGDGAAFHLAREFARGESDAFLDWVQDHRPGLFD